MAKLAALAWQAVEPLAALAAGLVAAAALLAALGYPAAEALWVMLSQGFADPEYLAARAAPLVATALAFAIPMKAGLFNIGGEGQLYTGALAALLAATLAPSPLTALAAGALAGAALGLLIGWLRARHNVNEVVSSIMLNWTAYYTTLYLVTNHLYDPSIPHQSIPLPGQARLPPAGGLAAAALLAALAHLVMAGTRHGYEIRVVGYSHDTARYAGIDPAKALQYSMALGGAFAGAGGALVLASLVPAIDTTMASLYGYGFNGIAVALLARLNPLAAIPAALLVSGLAIGGQMVELIVGAPPEVVDATVGIIVVFLALPTAYRLLAYKARTWMERRKTPVEKGGGP